MSDTRKIIIRLGGFLLPLLIGIVALFMAPLDKQYAYHFLKNECDDKGAWIYDRIFQNPAPVDVAFIGSSRTKAAVIEDTLEAAFSRYNKIVSVANMGYCRWGRNLDYALVKDLFKNRQPKYIVLEVHEEEERLSHIDFAYMADARDVLMPEMLFNQEIVTDVFHGLIIRFDVWKHRLIYAPAFGYDSLRHSYQAHGYSTEVFDAAALAAVKKERQHPKYISGDFENSINNKYPRAYLRRIVSLAHEHHCAVLFLYLPGYGSLPPAELDYYRHFGIVFVPPARILDSIANWRDPDHLNSNGSKLLSAWLAAQMASDSIDRLKTID